MRIKGLIVVILAISLLNCKGKQTENKALPISSMKFILWDMLKADEWSTQTALRDTLHKRVNENFLIYEQVFKIHQVSKAQFYTSYKYYETHPDQFKTLIDSVMAVGDRDKVIEKTKTVPANPK